MRACAHCLIVGGIVGLVLLPVLSPARAAEPATCRELERNFDLIKRDLDSIRLNSALFSAADAGCDAFAQRLLTAGAALAARDRGGAMPLAHAARAAGIRHR